MASITLQLKRGRKVETETYLGAHSEITHDEEQHGLILHEHWQNAVTTVYSGTLSGAGDSDGFSGTGTYVDGTYDVTTTCDAGTGCVVNITVSSGSVETVNSIKHGGSGYDL